MKSLFLIFLFTGFASLFASEWDNLPKPQKFLGDQVKEYMAQNSSLAPFPLYYTPRGKPAEIRVHQRGSVTALNWTGKKVVITNDDESPDPLIIKISHWKYLIWSGGKIVVKEIEDGAENIFDKFYGIQEPPKDPPGGDSSDYWKDDNSRWEYKP